MRTPETYYFHLGFISFAKHKGKVIYTVWFYDEQPEFLYTVKGGIVKDEAHLKQLLSVKSHKDVMEIQSLGSVYQ